jgi:hypothetical protein
MNERRPQFEQPRRESPSPDLARRAPHGPSHFSHPTEQRHGAYDDERRARLDQERENPPQRHESGLNGDGPSHRRQSVGPIAEGTPRRPSPVPSTGGKEKPDAARKRKPKEPASEKKEKKEKPVSREKKVPAEKKEKQANSGLKITLQKPKSSSTKDDDGAATGSPGIAGSSNEASPERTQPTVSRVIDDGEFQWESEFPN